MKAPRTRIEVVMIDGTTPTVPAYDFGAFAVHHTNGERDRGHRLTSWNVTHVPSGRAIVSSLKSFKLACAVAEALVEEETDRLFWELVNIDPVFLKATDAELGKKLRDKALAAAGVVS